MSKITRTATITAGVRGLACAGIATLITALFSWSFVASTESLNWMGSNAGPPPATAMMRKINTGLLHLTL